MFNRYFIRSIISLFIISFSAIVLFTGYSHSKSYTAQSGKSKILAVISQYDGDSCGNMHPPKYKIKQTSHGKLKVISRKVKLDSGPCVGRTIKFYFLSYTSNRGYRGQDRGSISYSHSQFTDSTIGSQTNMQVMINVK